MLMVFPKIATQNICVVDVEFDNMNVMQFAGMIFTRSLGDVFKLERTINLYVKRETVGHYAHQHTGFTPKFLDENGVDFEEFVILANNFMNSVDLNKTVFVSHGTKGDRNVLKSSGIYLPSHSLCTYKMSKRIFGEDKGHRLEDLAARSGLTGVKFHDAMFDVIATVSSLSFLLNNLLES